MKTKTLILLVLAAVICYSLLAPPSRDRPVLRLLSRIAGVWLLFRDPPPPVPNEHAYHAHAVGSLDHRNAL